MKIPTKEQIRKIADGVYCCLPEEDLLQVVEHSIREWEKIINNPKKIVGG